MFWLQMLLIPKEKLIIRKSIATIKLTTPKLRESKDIKVNSKRKRVSEELTNSNKEFPSFKSSFQVLIFLKI